MLKKILLLCTLTLGSAFLPSSSFVRPRAPLKVRDLKFNLTEPQPNLIQSNHPS